MNAMARRGWTSQAKSPGTWPGKKSIQIANRSAADAPSTPHTNCSSRTPKIHTFQPVRVTITADLPVHAEPIPEVDGRDGTSRRRLGPSLTERLTGSG